MERSLTSAQIAELVRGRLVGPPDIVVQGVAGLGDAEAHHVSFLANPLYENRVLPSAAGVVLIPETFTEPPPAGRAWVICENPSAAFVRVVAEFAPPAPEYPPGVHPAAVVADSARVADSAHIGPGAVIEAGARVGADTVIGANVYIGNSARIGAGCMIHPNVTIRERSLIGDRVIIHSGSVIGSDGFGYLSGPGGHEKIPQVGIVQIDDDVEIGALVAVDRARFGRTWIQQGTKIDNLVQIAHNVVIGRHCIIIAQVGIAGSSRLHDWVTLAGQAGIAGHVEIGDRCIVMAKGGISKDLPPGSIMMGAPAVPRKAYVRERADIHSIPKLRARIKALEKRLDDLAARAGQ